MDKIDNRIFELIADFNARTGVRPWYVILSPEDYLRLCAEAAGDIYWQAGAYPMTFDGLPIIILQGQSPKAIGAPEMELSSVGKIEREIPSRWEQIAKESDK